MSAFPRKKEKNFFFHGCGVGSFTTRYGLTLLIPPPHPPPSPIRKMVNENDQTKQVGYIRTYIGRHSKKKPLRRNLFPLPIPTPPPHLHPQPLHHDPQPLRRKRRAKQLLRRRRRPKLLAQGRPHRARMQGHADRLIARIPAQIDIQALGQLIDSGLAGAVRVPPAGAIVGDGADAGGHEGEDGGAGQVAGGGEGSAAFGEEGGEVFE